jgi:ribosomal protein S18 acetylase RimI-like enzyme
MKKEIRTARIDDLESLIHLLNQLFTQDIEFEADYEKQKNGLKEILENPGIGEILVLTIDDNIIGMVSLLYSISTALGGKAAVLEDMIIDKDFRGKNYGTELINEAIRFARERNVLRITLLTDFNNDPAINFYSNAGFIKSKMIPMRLILNGNQ